MTDDPDDDDALRWEGDDDAPLAPGWKKVGSPAPAGAPAGVVAGGSDDDDDDDDEDARPDADEERASQLGSVELVGLGVLGGVYLLYTIGWAVKASALVAATGVSAADPLGYAMGVLGGWLAALAPAAWFLVTLWLARGHRLARFVWLLVGAVVLVPLPFLFGFGAAA